MQRTHELKFVQNTFLINYAVILFSAYINHRSATSQAVIWYSCYCLEYSGGFRAARLPGQATPAARVVSSWVEKILVPPLNCRALDWSVVLTIGYYLSIGRLYPIVHQDNIVVTNKHNWPEFYPGNARACPGLELPMLELMLKLYSASLVLKEPQSDAVELKPWMTISYLYCRY